MFLYVLAIMSLLLFFIGYNDNEYPQPRYISRSNHLCENSDQSETTSKQWRRHGGDWGGTVPPTTLSGHFCESSKSDEKNLAVRGVTSSSIFGFLLNKVTKSIFFHKQGCSILTICMIKNCNCSRLFINLLLQ